MVDWAAHDDGDPVSGWTAEEGERLRVALRAAGWSQRRMAKALGYTEGNVSKWVRGRGTPSWGHLRAIAAQMKQPTATLLAALARTERTVPFRAALALETAPNGEGVRPSRILRGRLVYLPVEARANAGPGGGHVEREGYITVPAEWLEGIAGEQVVCVEIGGDCMQHDDPEHSLRDGDVALFDQRLTPRVGDIICVTVPDSGDDDGECLVKRVAAIDGESITLVPHLVLPGMPSFQRFRLEAIRLEGVLVGKYEMAGRSRLRRFQPAPRRALPAPENGQIAG